MRRNVPKDYARGTRLGSLASRASLATLALLAACDGHVLNVGLTGSTDAGVQAPGDGGLPHLQATLISATTSIAPQSAGAACAPWAQVEGLAFAPMTPAPAAGTTGEPLVESARRLAGTWIGHVTSPWANWDVAVAFSSSDADGGGSYEAISDSATVSSFYYGSDLPCMMKKWRVLNADTAGLEGDINVTYVTFADSPDGDDVLADAGPGAGANGDVGLADGDVSAGDASAVGGGEDVSSPASCYLPGWQGQFHAMTFDMNENRLRFTFGTGESQGYYPISFDLWRVCGE
jgi:hypothetical protein